MSQVDPAKFIAVGFKIGSEGSIGFARSSFALLPRE
jgi:hypothetical protein